MSNLFDILSPANNDITSKSKKEKVVKQLITKLAKSQSLQQAQYRNASSKKLPKRNQVTEIFVEHVRD